MDTTQIYALLDPRDGRVRYVGKSHHPERRVIEHLSYWRSVPNKGFRKWLGELRSLSLHPAAIVLDTVPVDVWRNAERKWIADLRRSGFNLLNLHEGGWGGDLDWDGSRGRAIGYALKGKPKSEQHRKAIGDALRGRSIPENTKAKMRANHWSKRIAKTRSGRRTELQRQTMKPANHLSDDELLERIRARARELGHVPNSIEMGNRRIAIRRRFGTWHRALQLAGFEKTIPQYLKTKLIIPVKTKGSSYPRRFVRQDGYQIMSRAGIRNGMAKLAADDIVAIRKAYDSGGITITELAAKYPVCWQMISRIVRREAWTSV